MTENETFKIAVHCPVLWTTENPDTGNPVTMSMLTSLRTQGTEFMSGNCKYPETACPHMTVLNGKTYCDATPCQLTGELPKRTNAARIRNMSDEELAKFISEFSACQVCKYFNEELDRCGASINFLCVKAYAESITGDWLKQPVED